MSNIVKDNYLNGVCPDCGEKIPDDATDTWCCPNCDHACFSEHYDPEIVSREELMRQISNVLPHCHGDHIAQVVNKIFPTAEVVYDNNSGLFKIFQER